MKDRVASRPPFAADSLGDDDEPLESLPTLGTQASSTGFTPTRPVFIPPQKSVADAGKIKEIKSKKTKVSHEMSDMVDNLAAKKSDDVMQIINFLKEKNDKEFQLQIMQKKADMLTKLISGGMDKQEAKDLAEETFPLL